MNKISPDSFRPPPEGHVRVTTMRHLGSLIRALGADVGAVFRSARCDERLLLDRDATIPVAIRGALFAQAALATNSEHFGLIVGQHSGPGELGIPGRMVLLSPTVGEALGNLCRFWHLHNPTSVILLRPVGSAVEFGCAVLDGNHPGMAIFEDGALAIALNVMRHMLGESWSPSSVHLMRRQPRNTTPYTDFFGAPCHFNAPSSVLRFPRELLRCAPLSGNAKSVAIELATLIEQADAQSVMSWGECARRQIYVLLLQGKYNQQSLADALGISTRTMSRRLAGGGMTYLELLEVARFSASRMLMRETDMSIGDVAQVLGYTEASSFTRAFRRWAGMTPDAWRQSKRHENSDSA